MEWAFYTHLPEKSSQKVENGLFYVKIYIQTLAGHI
ncbi:hypothetical protein HH_0493 [Helicobacter hepaticus ATCC 51449]|uniref:Uncharacterized protein n=1 Tax=Helicobacter hepaticus (strain ATCC 51449 / 3B1) TaxID=235279 RepID=Q7VIW1_HELHP|nr:hypothetical protein HH_0493 [Helicobacter hepaticus ATCC 51449]